MLDQIIEFSIKNKIIIGLFTLGLMIWGGYSLTQLPIDAVPDITNNQVQIITSAPTLAAQEVERSITFPVEMAMANIPDVVESRSISRFGLSVVTIVFKDQVDIYRARQMVSERMKSAEAEIPVGLGRPELAPVTTGLGEIYQYILHTKPGFEHKYSPMDLRTFQDWIVRRQLLGTPGVADVSSFGGYLKQYEIAIDPEKLRSTNLAMSDIFTALEKNNENTGGAYIDKKPNAYFIRGLGLVNTIEDIRKIVVKNTHSGLPIFIRDVATVGFGSAARYGAMTRNEEGEVVGAMVLMLKGANSAQVIKDVKDKVATIQKTLPEGVVIEAFLDRTHLVDRAIGTVSRNLMEGGLIVVFVLVLMLGNLRAGLVVASVIPLAMLFAIAMMNLFGVSGNLMSLGAIDFGLIVDGAVIIVESIVHRISSNASLHGLGRLNQPQMDEQVRDASIKIRNSAAFGEIIILIVYLPILALVGIEGKMFKPMAETVAFAIMGAFILSLTYVPMASALFLSKKTVHKKNFSDRMIAFFHRLYTPVIHFSLKNKMTVMVISGTLLAFSLFIFSRLGGEFIPTLEEGDFAVETRLMSGASLSQSVEVMKEASGILLKQFPEVKQVVGKIGSSEIPVDPMPIESGDMMIILKDKEEWTSASTREALVEKMSEALEQLPGVEFGFQQPIQMRFNELMTGARQDVAIKLFGEDLEVLVAQAKQMANLVRPVNGVQDLYVEKITGLPQIQVKYNRDRIAQYGLTISDVNRVLRTAFAGETAGVVFEGEKRFDMVVRLSSPFRQSLTDIQALFIPLPDGNQIPLEQIATVSFEEGPMQISREDTKRRITVGFNVRNRDVESIVTEIQQKLDRNLKLPAGYYLTYGGQFENLLEAKQRLAVAVPMALFLILILLYFTFGSVQQTLLIFTAVPLSAIGGIFALWIRGMPFSISAGVGFIALFGVAVLNGIVLIGYFNQLKSEGVTDIIERVLIGTEVRLRPVLMTALVASFGFLPMALSSSAGAEVQKPLATVVIGGLLTATLLTLVVLPVLYVFMAKKEEEEGRRLGSNSISPALPLLLLLVACLFFPANGYAQTSTPARTFTLAKAIDEALKNNGSIQTATLEIEAQKNSRKTAVDLGKTAFSLTRGQINSIHTDNNFTLTQNFAFPGLYAHQSNLAQSMVKSSEQQLRIRQNQLTRDVKNAYVQLTYFLSQRKLLIRQDSIYTRFAKAAQLRYKTGESNFLETATAETQLMELKSALARTEGDIIIGQRQLQTLLNTTAQVSIADSNLTKWAFEAAIDSSTLVQNPTLALLRQEMEVNKQASKVEKARLLPDFSLGYFNQSLNGTQLIDGVETNYTSRNRFTGFQVGIALPLWFRPQAARIATAKINEQIAAINFDHQQRQLEGELAILVQQWLKYRNSLAYYEKSALPQAELIVQHAQKSFRAGSIDYIEYVHGLTQAMSIQTNYLQNLHQHNQAIISIEFILGEK
ncbi:MAG: CusA/CzcA family heavy metal efflux RND transporter [Bacteroidota bacterium]